MGMAELRQEGKWAAAVGGGGVRVIGEGEDAGRKKMSCRGVGQISRLCGWTKARRPCISRVNIIFIIHYNEGAKDAKILAYIFSSTHVKRTASGASYRPPWLIYFDLKREREREKCEKVQVS